VPRRRAWADFFVDLTLVDGVPQCVDFLAQGVNLDTLTVARIIGTLYVQHADLSAQIDNRAKIDIGIGVASVEAFGIAACAGLAIPNGAGSSPPRGWLYRTEMVCTKVHATGTTYEILIPDKTHFDLGAMRKIDKGVLYLVAEQTNDGGTAASVALMGLVRTMVLT